MAISLQKQGRTAGESMLVHVYTVHTRHVFRLGEDLSHNSSPSAVHTVDLHLAAIWSRGLSGRPPSQAQPESLITWQR